MEIYQGTILQPAPEKPEGFEMIKHGLVAVEKGKIAYAGPDGDFQEANFPQLKHAPHRENQLAILPPTVNCHDHAFQPPGIPGELITRDAAGRFIGWLPETLREGEVRAKSNVVDAVRMARSRLQKFARNGIGTVLEYATSSRQSVAAVLSSAVDIGLRAKAGYVCMDQGIADIAPSLQTTSTEAIEDTRWIIEKYGPKNVVVIDRFTFAVSSATRRSAAKDARQHGILYETHCNETVAEKDLHAERYDTRSIIQTLLEDGVFEPGSRVGLAHCIHTSEDEMRLIERKIQGGCEVSIRACPNSNAALGSHWDADGRYHEFPLQEWERIGALITLGTDQGAGRNANIFAEMLDERGRHPQKRQPSYTDLLRYGIINGYRSLSIDPESIRLATGSAAEFIVVKMAGADGFYKDTDDPGDLEKVAARIIEGGSRTENILASYVAGKKVK